MYLCAVPLSRCVILWPSSWTRCILHIPSPKQFSLPFQHRVGCWWKVSLNVSLVHPGVSPVLQCSCIHVFAVIRSSSASWLSPAILLRRCIFYLENKYEFLLTAQLTMTHGWVELVRISIIFTIRITDMSVYLYFNEPVRRIITANCYTIVFTRFAWCFDCKIITVLWYIHTHALYERIWKKSCIFIIYRFCNAFLMKHKRRLHLTTRKHFCKNNSYVVLVENRSPVSGNEEYSNLSVKHLGNDTFLSY